MSDDAVINLISKSFVPVALNLYKIRDAKGEGGDFFRLVWKQKPEYQGMWLATPEGRCLEYAFGNAEDARKVLTSLRSGLKAFGEVTPREVGPANSLPYRGVGVRPDGSVTLAITDKGIPVADLSQKIHPNAIPQIFVGSVTLSAAEWLALAPSDVHEGSQWAVPQAVGRQFFSLLSPFSTVFREPGEVTDVRIIGRVASIRDGIAHLVYRGLIVGISPGDAAAGLAGQEYLTSMKIAAAVGSYDIQAGHMLSLTWVWDGRHTGYYKPPYRGQPDRFGAVVEWRRGDPTGGDQFKHEPPRPQTKIELVDSTPEDALRTFLLALAAQDAATLGAVTVPHAQFDWLLKSLPAPEDQLTRMQARLQTRSMRRMKVGDAVKMPDGESRVIKPADVSEGRVVLWPAGEPLPCRLENVGGQWKVFAAPFIAARKQ